MKGARKGVMKEGATREGAITPGDASDGRVSGLVYNQIGLPLGRDFFNEITDNYTIQISLLMPELRFPLFPDALKRS